MIKSNMHQYTVFNNDMSSWHGIVQEVTWDLEWVEVTEHA